MSPPSQSLLKSTNFVADGEQERTNNTIKSQLRRERLHTAQSVKRTHLSRGPIDARHNVRASSFPAYRLSAHQHPAGERHPGPYPWMESSYLPSHFYSKPPRCRHNAHRQHQCRALIEQGGISAPGRVPEEVMAYLKAVSTKMDGIVKRIAVIERSARSRWRRQERAVSVFCSECIPTLHPPTTH